MHVSRDKVSFSNYYSSARSTTWRRNYHNDGALFTTLYEVVGQLSKGTRLSGLQTNKSTPMLNTGSSIEGLQRYGDNDPDLTLLPHCVIAPLDQALHDNYLFWNAGSFKQTAN